MEPCQCASHTTYADGPATSAQTSDMGLFQTALRFTQRSAAGAWPRICYTSEIFSLFLFLFIPPLYSRELVAIVRQYDDDDIAALAGPLGPYTSHWKEVMGASGVVVMYVGSCLVSIANSNSQPCSCLLTVLQLSQVSESVLAKAFVLFALALAFQSLCASFAYYRMSHSMHTKEHGRTWRTVRPFHNAYVVLPDRHTKRSFLSRLSCISPAYLPYRSQISYGGYIHVAPITLMFMTLIGA